MLSTRESSAAPSDGAHLVVSPQRSGLRFGPTGIGHLRPLVTIAILFWTGIHLSWIGDCTRLSNRHGRAVPFEFYPPPITLIDMIFVDSSRPRDIARLFSGIFA